jgi:hypothetical protein
MIEQKTLACTEGFFVRHEDAFDTMGSRTVEGLVTNALRSQGRGNRCDAIDLYWLSRLFGGVKRGSTFGFYSDDRNVLPAIAMQAFDHSAKQSATALIKKCIG